MRDTSKPGLINIVSTLFLVGFAFLSIVISNAVHAKPDETVKIGVLAFRGHDKAHKQWTPLSDYLTQSISGKKFEIVTLTNDDITRAVTKHEIDFLLTNPLSYASLEAASESGMSQLATMRNRRANGNYTKFAAIIFARSDRTDIRTLQDLRGKSFAAVHKNAFGGWLMAKREMIQQGFDPEQELSTIKYVGFPQDNIVLAVLNGEVDAGTVRTDVLESMAVQGVIDLSDFQIINAQSMSFDYPFARSTRLYPEWPFAVLQHVPVELARQTSVALFNLSENGTVAKASHIAGWTIPLNYSSVYDLMQELKVGPYDKTYKATLYELLVRHWVFTLIVILVLVAAIFMLLKAARTIMMLKYKKDSLEGMLAKTDHLTGAMNLSEFERKLKEIIDDESDEEHTLMYMNLDHFKIINDSISHHAGDEYLKHISQLLKQLIRNGDILARVGGDEFGVLLRGCPASKSTNIAEKFRKTVESFDFSWEDKNINVCASIGVMSINTKTKDVHKLLRSVSSACSVAKSNGKNCIHLVDDDDRALQRAESDIVMLGRIRKAIKENRFCLHYQSIIPLIEGNRDIHCELLIRMIDESGELIAPGSFLPIAERYNLAGDIDRWVISTALSSKEIMDFIEKNNISRIAINLSGQSLAAPKFLSFLIDKVNNSRIGPDKICFEITETAAISNMTEAKKFISILRGMGCLFALDDFGSGMSSYSYLSNLSVDFLKIDGHLVLNMDTNPVNKAMVESINKIGHVMGIKTIAEFVENEACIGILREIGVDYAQGYAINRPSLIAMTHLKETQSAEKTGMDDDISLSSNIVKLRKP